MMQQVSFVRLTAESSSVLDGEETGCPALRLRRTVLLRLVAVAALRPCHFALRVLDVVKTPYLL